MVFVSVSWTDHQRKAFVQIAYVDDSGSDPQSPLVVVGGVVIPDTRFFEVEQAVGSVVASLIPPELRDEFSEFHAADFLNGARPFQLIPEAKRREAARRLLATLARCSLRFIYSAVVREKLINSPGRTAQPIDAAFTICVLGIEDWLATQAVSAMWPDSESLCVLVVDDDVSDTATKTAFKKSFRLLRKQPHVNDGTAYFTKARLKHLHDAMYFGDSADSIGIQIAGLCAYVMQQHLRGIQDASGLFEMLAPHAICAHPEPDSSDFKFCLVSHDAS
jgi:Protein of unknown function (DUF3800)